MPSIATMSVPKRAHASIRLLADLSDEQMDALEQAVGPASSLRSPGDLVRQLADLGAPFDDAVSQDLARTLFNLCTLHTTHGWSLQDIATTASRTPELEFDEQTQIRVADRLYRLVNLEKVSGLAKATSVAYEYGATFHTGRVLTDLRPVFQDDPKSGPSGAVIAHTLRIDYFARSGSDEFYVTLDSRDVDDLIETLERAKAKYESLQRLIADLGIVEYDTAFE